MAYMILIRLGSFTSLTLRILKVMVTEHMYLVSNPALLISRHLRSHK
jgi:hypothetical protein